MALADTARKIVGSDAESRKIPRDVDEKLKRGRARRDEGSGMRNVCLEMYRGNQYLWLGESNRVYDQRNYVKQQLTPEEYKHRVFKTTNLIRPLVDEKVSACTQRVPGFDATANSGDHEDYVAAKLADKIALAGYDRWNLRKVAEKACRLAFVADESFTWSYWDSSVGPFIEDGEGNLIGQGEVRHRVFSGNEVMWEPGVEYEDSPWIGVEYARPIDELEKTPGYEGGKLKPDAETNKVVGRSGPKDAKNLVITTEYFERPCPDYPEGRWLCFANGKRIYPPDTYPLRDHEDEVIDEPLFDRLYFSADPEAERALGLVRDMIDPQRTVLDADNKAAEWKNLALSPQLVVQKGALGGKRPSNAVGATIEVDQMPGAIEPKWRDVPPIPRELFEMSDRARADLATIAHGGELAAGEIESGKEAQALAEQQKLAWSNFLVQFAEWWSRLMRDDLNLVQRHYTEGRLMKFKGRTGVGVLEGFMGADLRGQTDIRVSPGSLEPRTREAVAQRVMNIAQMFPGYFAPEVLMSAMEGGNAESLLEDYERDLDRANLVIQKIKRGPEYLFGTAEAPAPMRPAFPEEQYPDPETGETVTEVPDWMPRPFDGVPVHKAVFASYMKSDEYDQLALESKQAIHEYYNALQRIEGQKAAQAAQQQALQAEQMGMQNATRSPNGKPLPSLPALPT